MNEKAPVTCFAEYPNKKTPQLVYTSRTDAGITRIKKGKKFCYIKNNHAIRDKRTLSRIQSLVIPPAWNNVWITAKENGHLQCTGVDAMGRIQYRYHPLWNTLRKENKFHRLLLFGKALKKLRKKVSLHLSEKKLSRRKVLATVVSTLDKTGLRVGNAAYEKRYGSFGLSTLQDRHIRINGTKVYFSFKGKKGVYQRTSMQSARLARIIGQCKEIPGKELFQYVDEAGDRHSISSGDVNAYIKEHTGGDFTSKDFRTWNGTMQCIKCFLEKGPAATKTEARKNIIATLDTVSQTLGNTSAVCKKHYVHPIILTLYEEGSLFNKPQNLQNGHPPQEVMIETMLLRLLKKAAGKNTR
ncbi:MAG: DNA topoisomerase IB [Niabella sp.]